MSPEEGLAIRKPVSTWSKPLKVNFKDLFKALGKAGFDTATQQWIGVGKDAVDVIAAVGLDSNKPAKLAWASIYKALVRAIAIERISHRLVNSKSFSPQFSVDHF